MKMKHAKSIFLIMFLLINNILYAQQIKNVILLIPDGTSLDLLTLSRWYNNNQPLAVDSMICGLVKTHLIDNKFPDSAPTSTAYATGVRTNKKCVGVDSSAVPQISVLELSKMKGMSTGVVVTCQFPHATPADFVCHTNARDSSRIISKQFIYNSPNVVFAGGKSYIDEFKYDNDLKKENIQLITDKQSFQQLSKLTSATKSVWALFPDWSGKTEALSFECDRPNTEPSLHEMTKKAIDLLQQNKNGFFLIVEGSQVDWACHNNDPYAAVTDFVEFDKAVSEAVKFAKTNENTIVIVCPDHGNGGISIGNSKSNGGFMKKNSTRYDQIDIYKQIVAPLKQVKWSGAKLAEYIYNDSLYAHADTVKKYYNVTLSNSTIESFKKIRTYKTASYKLVDTIQFILGQNFSSQNYIGWTTTGHTAEDVFLGIYAPKGIEKLSGVVYNSQIGMYIAEQLRLGSMKDSTDKYFCSHKKIFNSAEIKQMNRDSLLIVKNNMELIIYANTKRMIIKKGTSVVEHKTPTNAICIENKNEFIYYIPQNTMNLLK